MRKMETYIGTKMVNARPMTRRAYNEYRNWALPEGENGDDEGFMVEHLFTNFPNTPDYDGYISWSPVEVFNQTYKPVLGMNFGDAINALKCGMKVSREGWNGKGMFLFLVPGSHFTVNRPPLLGIYPEGTEIDYLPHIDMRTSTGEVVPWLASQTDMLAEDWVILVK